jgi:hypothetical protein
VLLNTLHIGEHVYLIVDGPGGTAHLASEQTEGGRPAFLGREFARARQRGFAGDDASLRARRWSPKAVCGRKWVSMSATDETRAFYWFDVDEVVAPRCEACLEGLDDDLVAPKVEAAVFLLAELAADQVVACGSAEISGVPADQVEHVLKQARESVRSRGFTCESIAVDGGVYMYALSACDEGEPPAPSSSWLLQWSTWEASTR